ncbi:MAG: OmpA family protein, partial [Alphaproteobacteria bacterium]
MFLPSRIRLGALVASGLLLSGTVALAQEPVVVGGTGKPSVSVDTSVLDSLGPSWVVPQLMMPGPGPARNGRIELHAPGTAPAAATQAPPEPVEMTPPEPAMAEPERAEPEEKIVLTPPAPKAAPVEPVEEEMAEPAPMPAPMPAPAPAPAPVAEKAEKKMAEPPAPAPVQEMPKGEPAMPEKVLLTPPPAVTQPKQAAKPKPAAPVEMPDAPPPPVTLTEPKPTPPPAPKTAAKETPPAVKEPAMREAVEETARLPSPTVPVKLDEPLRIEFANESALLSEKAKGDLATYAEYLKNTPSMRVQLLAYAKGDEETASQARRLSLSRARVVRSYLIE